MKKSESLCRDLAIKHRLFELLTLPMCNYIIMTAEDQSVFCNLRIDPDALTCFCDRVIPNFKLYIPGKRGGGKCPLHDDHDPSLTVYLDSGRFLCGGACAQGQRFKLWTLPDFCRANGWCLDPLLYLPGHRPEKTYRGPEYVYVDSEGLPFMKMAVYWRDGYKYFSAWHYDKFLGVWCKGAPDKRILYNLPGLQRAAENDLVIYVEGEKDAQALIDLGFCATTNPFGAGNAKGVYSQICSLARFRVLVIPDNDGEGALLASYVARTLRAHGGQVWVHRWSFPEHLQKGYDISDFIEDEKKLGRDPAISLGRIITSIDWRACK